MECQNNKVFDIIQNLAKRLIKLQKAIANAVEVNFNELKIFGALSVGSQIPQSKVGELCGIDKSATSRMLDKMEINGYIDKFFKQGNKKTIYISLTKKGEQFNKLIKQNLIKLIPNYFNKLTEEDETQFLNLINKMLDKKL